MPKYHIFSTLLFQQHVKEQHAVDMLLINLHLITALALHHAVGFAMQVQMITICRGKNCRASSLNILSLCGSAQVMPQMEPPPELLMPLLPYQKEFLAWAIKQEQSDVRGGCGPCLLRIIVRPQADLLYT